MTTEPATVTAHDLFISYAEADRAWVDGFLLDALDAAGVTYHSEDAFALGVPRLVEFERAIKQSGRTLLILSPAYLADTFGQFVDVLVNSYGMETATWPVIPLTLQEVALPPRLSQLVRLDAATPEAQQRALAKLCAELKRPVPGPASLPACPYPGMVPFDEADSARFFGREQEVQELVERLRLQPFLAVIGASGSGKSSLVRAGLIPALRKSQAFGSGDWLVRTMRPGAAPLETLTQLITDIPRARELGAAANGANAAADLALPAGTRLLLVVDQFEETFTTAGAEAQAFQQTLQRLAAAPGCSVVLTARADFYADMMLSPLWASIQANRVEITPLGEAGLRRAIIRPAELADVAIEAALVERLVDDAAGEPGVLPLVQETLVLLWERLERRFLPMRAYDALVLTRDSYGGQIGGERSGLQVAIARRADATLAHLTEPQQTIARRIFLRLIQFGEGRADTRRQQPLDALCSAGDDPRLFDQTRQQLEQGRLITLTSTATTDHRPPTTDQRENTPSSVVGRPSSVRVDISHEALIGGWPVLQGWLSERRESELTRRRLEGKVHEWARLGGESGGLLDEIEVLEADRWLQGAEATDIGFDKALPELIARSKAAITAVKQAQEAARQRELDQAKALAEEQRQRAEEQAAAGAQLRRRALFLAGAAGVAVLAMIAAMVLLGRSQRSEAEAVSQKGIAEQQRGIADQQKSAAETNAAEARRQQTAAETNAAEARRQTDLAQQRELQARISKLATQSQLALARSPQRSLLLATEALNLSSQFGEPAAAASIDALRAGLAEISGQTLVGAEQPASAVAYSADGRYLAIGSQGGPVRVLNMQAGDPLAQPIELRGHEGQVAAISFSPDGRYLASGSFDGTARLWDLQAADPSAAPLALRGHSAQVLALAWSPDGRFLASGGADGAARIWDTANLSADPLPLDGHAGGVATLAWSPNGRFLATGSLDGTGRIWDTQAADSADAQVLHGDDEIVTALAWSPDSRYLATGGGEQSFTIWLWDRTDIDAPRQLQGHVLAVTSLLFSPDGQTLISASRDRTARLWDMRAADLSIAPVVLRGHADEIRAAALSRDGGLLATGGHDNTLRLWNLADSDPNANVRVLKGHDADIFALAFNADASAIVTASDDGTARLWRLDGDSSDGSSILQDPASDGVVTALGWSPNGRFLATSQSDGSARLWDRQAGASSALTVLPGEQGPSNGLAWRPDGQMLATASDGPNVQLWDVSSADFAAQPALLPGAADGTLTLAWSPDGKYLAGSSPDNAIWLWDMTAADPGSAPTMLQGHAQPVYRLAWSPDSHTLASASVDTTVRLWDLRAADPGAQPVILKGHARAVVAVAFSPDGRALASGSWDGTARVWDLSSDTPGTNPIILHDHTQEVAAVAWSPDGRYLVTTGYDASARQWDMRAADPAAGAIVLSDTSSVTAVAFSPDGHTLATGNAGASVRLWPLELPRLIDLACRAAGRNLTWAEWQQFFEQADYRRTCANLPPHASYLAHLLDAAAARAQAGNIRAALAAYTTVQQLSPSYQIDAEHWNALCRNGALWGQVKSVLEACGAAVALAPSDGSAHESRGLARALTGDPTGAADDFAAYIAWQQQQPEPDTDAITQREQWIAYLQAGRNPFDRATLDELRAQS